MLNGKRRKTRPGLDGFICLDGVIKMAVHLLRQPGL